MKNMLRRNFLKMAGLAAGASGLSRDALAARKPSLAQAGWREVGRMAAGQPRGNQFTFRSREATVAITVLAPDLVRVRLWQGSTPPPDYSWAVVKKNWPETQVQFSSDKTKGVIRTPEFEIRTQLDPFRLAWYDLAGNLISRDADSPGMAHDGSRVRCWKAMPAEERYFGLGEKTGPLDKRGHSYVMWNTDPGGYNALTDPMYQSVPFFLGLQHGKAYGIFFDNTYRSSFDMGAEFADTYSFGAEGGEINYYFFYGPDPKKVVTRFTELVGRASLPPKWSLGYIQSSAHYSSEKIYRFIANSLRLREIPCDALFLDTVYMEGSRIFTWDKTAFPDPPKMLADLLQQGFHTYAIVDPGAKADPNYYVYQQGLAGDYFLKRKNGKVYTGEIWPGESAFPDFTSEKTRAWWASLVADFRKAGLAGFLCDMNEPTVDAIPLSKGWIPRGLDDDVVYDDHGLNSHEAKNHNIFGLLMSAATRQGLLQSRPNERPFVITRATYAGGQRYAAQWTGDNLATWEDLRTSLRLVQSMGISGLVFTGSDIGGFVFIPDAELYTRWLESAVFLPLFVTHNVAHWTTHQSVDPLSFGQESEIINRRSIELRYRLLPYLYNAFYQATQTGLPIVRPLMLDYPNDPKVLDETPAQELNEFLFGEDLLVAPVIRGGENTRKVYLPKGTWYGFWDDRRYEGPVATIVPAPLGRIPVFVRAGAILPMQQVVQYTGQAPINPLTLEIYPEGSSSREYYEDDGSSLDYQRGVFLLEKFSAAESEGLVTITSANRKGSYVPPARSLLLKLHAQQTPPKAVKLNGQELAMASSLAALGKAVTGAAFDGAARTVHVKFPDPNAPFEVQIAR
jgi:alpha-glucosidase